MSAAIDPPGADTTEDVRTSQEAAEQDAAEQEAVGQDAGQDAAGSEGSRRSVAAGPLRLGPARLRFEAPLAVLVAALLAMLMNTDQVSQLTTTAPGDLGDPLYFAWQLAWVGHTLFTDPGALWTTPAFLQAPDNLA